MGMELCKKKDPVKKLCRVEKLRREPLGGLKLDCHFLGGNEFLPMLWTPRRMQYIFKFFLTHKIDQLFAVFSGKA